jgi:hypothetical protein
MGNPLVALDFRPTTPTPNALDMYTRAMQLRGMAGQQQLQQQQIQGAQLENQQRQLQLQDQLLWRQVGTDKSIDWTQPDSMDKAVQSFIQKGGSPATARTFQMQNAQYRNMVSEMNARDFASHQTMLDNLLSKGKSVNAIQDPVQRQLAYEKEMADLKAGGLDTSKWPQQVPDAATLEMTLNGFMSAKAQAEDMQARARMKSAGKTPEPETLLTDAQKAQLNQGYAAILAKYMPGMQTPTWGQLGQNATEKDADRIDKLISQYGSEQDRELTRQALKAQREQAAELARQRTEEGKETKEAKWMTWNEAGRQVAGPMSQAKASGATEYAELPAQEVRDVMNARHAVMLMTKTGDRSKPETQGVLQLINSLDKDGKLGVLASRYNSFLTSGVGTSPGDDPRIITLIDKNMLGDTAAMLAHFGASGGRSPQMLQHFLDLANARKMDGPTLKAGVKAMADYMNDRAMIPGGTQAGTQPAKTAPKQGGVIYARDPNGQLHKAAPGTPLPPGWKFESQ